MNTRRQGACYRSSAESSLPLPGHCSTRPAADSTSAVSHPPEFLRPAINARNDRSVSPYHSVVSIGMFRATASSRRLFAVHITVPGTAVTMPTTLTADSLNSDNGISGKRYDRYNRHSLSAGAWREVRRGPEPVETAVYIVIGTETGCSGVLSVTSPPTGFKSVRRPAGLRTAREPAGLHRNAPDPSAHPADGRSWPVRR